MLSGLVDNIISELEEIELWFEQQSTFYFYDSSVLIAYDAVNLEQGPFPLANPVPETRVRIADFAHVSPNLERTKDMNYLQGFKELIATFRNLDIKRKQIYHNANRLHKNKRR